MSEQHERFEALVTKLVEGAVNESERAEIQAHLASCPECRSSWESEKRAKEAMIQETKAFAEGYDAGRLEANLAHELRSGANWARGLLALGACFGLLTVVLFARPIASQPEAWTATFPMAVASLATLAWVRRRQARFVAIARAAEGARGGYRELEAAGIRINVREFRWCGRWGLAVAFAVPTMVCLWGLLTRIQLRHAFPTAEIQVHLLRSLVSPVILASLLIAISLYCLGKARQLEASLEREGKGSDLPPGPRS